MGDTCGYLMVREHTVEASTEVSIGRMDSIAVQPNELPWKSPCQLFGFGSISCVG